MKEDIMEINELISLIKQVDPTDNKRYRDWIVDQCYNTIQPEDFDLSEIFIWFLKFFRKTFLSSLEIGFGKKKFIIIQIHIKKPF